jgi:hypothetical protein
MAAHRPPLAMSPKLFLLLHLEDAYLLVSRSNCTKNGWF